eukprot:TRINITY_DN6809_c0_g1_i1.p5 TRINITY_DN6809_c0_g1~~TRINITY_DN6809_c0_g1_i1.p5  ORF type:complete len:113 (+),score=0.33 TRINITY_DN6809_c0_g1_i1:903-1241(+)
MWQHISGGAARGAVKSVVPVQRSHGCSALLGTHSWFRSYCDSAHTPSRQQALLVGSRSVTGCCDAHRLRATRRPFIHILTLERYTSASILGRAPQLCMPFAENRSTCWANPP